MLQSMRQSTQSTAAKVIIGLIVLSFAAFGLETLLPGGSGTSVAEVNGEEITPFALQEACLLYTSPSPRDAHETRMPSSA